MLKKNRFILLLLAFLAGFSSMYCSAQSYSTLCFDYDANGNRVLYSIGFVDNDRGGQGGGERLVTEVSESLAGMQVRLYPNPTSARFTVSLCEDGSGTAKAILTTADGVVLEERRLSGSSAEFDLTGRSPGIYLLTLVVDGESKSWKVLKYQP